MPREIDTVWMFKSDTSPDKVYQAIRYEDGSTSCDCRGWTFKRRSANGERTCKHTRWIDAEIANDIAISFKQYSKSRSQTTAATVRVEAERFIVLPQSQ